MKSDLFEVVINKCNECAILSDEKINAIASFVKKIVESAGNKTFYEIISKLCDAAGIKLSPEILNNILAQINIIKKGIDLATYAWDIRRTPTYETVSIKLCK